jgi:hypothetical protein
MDRLARQGAKVTYEQLFDLEKDPWEMKNEIRSPKYQQMLTTMRDQLARWERQTKAVPPCKRVPKKAATRSRTPA